MSPTAASSTSARRSRELAGCTPDELADVARALFETIPLPAWVFNRETLRVAAVNDAAVQHYGYTREEFLSLTVDTLRPPDEQARLRDELARDVVDGPEQRGRWRHRKRDGTIIPVEITRHHVTWAGSPAWLVVVNDVSAREQAAAALRASHDLFNAVLEGASDPIFIKDLHGTYLLVNSAESAALGCTPAEMTGCRDRDLFPAEYAERIRQTDAEVVRANAPALFELTLPTVDGLRTYLVTKSPHRDTDGSVIGVIGIAKDITERKHSEDMIRRLTVAVEQSPAAVVVTDTKGRIEYVNRRFTEITGYTSAEVLGKTPRVLQSGITPPEVYKDLWTTITAGREWTGVMQNRRKDGQLYWDSATVSPVRDTTGVVTHFVAIKQDVSAQRLLEDQFRQAQKMEAVGRLAGGVAHDFNNLLSVITSYSEMVLEDLGPADPRRADLDEIRKAAVAAAGLTRQLLAFSRQQVLQPRVLSPNAVIEGVDKMLRRLIGEDVALTTVLAPDIGSIKADPGQMEQVIMNLAVNARDAMPEGGQLTIATSNIELDSHYAGDHIPVVAGPYVLLAVTDTGSGMDDETKRRLFEPFFTTKEKGKGTGLGLATVYGIVKQSGGFIWVYSELGQGTTFKIYLPRVADEPMAAEAPRSPESVHGTETVLLAEDSPGVRSAARQILGRLGYTVIDAPNGAAALALAASLTGPLDLLVTDVVMPEMSGRQLAERLTALRPGLKVLYVSGYTDDAVVRHGVLEAGISYLEKPFTPERLARKVREVLDAGKRGEP